MTEYIYAEPETDMRTVYVDTDGHAHETREQAIAATVRSDLESHIRQQLVRAWPDDHDERKFIAAAIVSQIASPHNKELRVMVADLIEATS